MSAPPMIRIRAMSEADVRLIINQVRNRADGDIRASDRWLLGHLVQDLLDLANHKHNTEGQMAKKPTKVDPVVAKLAADMGIAEPRYGSPSWSLKNNGLHSEVRYKGDIVNAFTRCIMSFHLPAIPFSMPLNLFGPFVIMCMQLASGAFGR